MSFCGVTVTANKLANLPICTSIRSAAGSRSVLDRAASSSMDLRSRRWIDRPAGQENLLRIYGDVFREMDLCNRKRALSRPLAFSLVLFAWLRPRELHAAGCFTLVEEQAGEDAEVLHAVGGHGEGLRAEPLRPQRELVRLELEHADIAHVEVSCRPAAVVMALLPRD